jgi:hypothetical protein
LPWRPWPARPAANQPGRPSCGPECLCALRPRPARSCSAPS